MPRRSKVLPLGQVRAVFDLVHECCELGADPSCWRRHLVRSMPALFKTQIGVAGLIDARQVAMGADAGELLRTLIDHGWRDERQRAQYVEMLGRMAARRDPNFNPILKALFERGGSEIALRRELVSDRAWYGAEFGEDYLRATGLDDPLVALQPLGTTSFVIVMAQRAWNDLPFDGRDALVMELLRGELARQVETGALAGFGEPSVTRLPQRLRDVLRCLLEGESEKMIAPRLGLSRHTVHEHVKRLHQHFEVRSRGELLARCRRYYACLSRDMMD